MACGMSQDIDILLCESVFFLLKIYIRKIPHNIETESGNRLERLLVRMVDGRIVHS